MVIYSTTGDPNNWQKEYSLSPYEYKVNASNYGHRYNHPTYPELPDWVFDKDNNRYYKAATNYSSILFNGKYYFSTYSASK